MTTQDINALLDKHLSDWLGSESGPTLRERMADAIREAVAAQDKLWAAGNATLRYERDQTRLVLGKVAIDLSRVTTAVQMGTYTKENAAHSEAALMEAQNFLEPKSRP